QRDATGDALRTDLDADLGWPVTHAVEHLALLVMALPRYPPADVPVDAETVGRLDATLRALAEVAEGRPVPVPPPPPLDALPRTAQAVAALRDVLAELGRARVAAG
ncbi:MAG: hypothetical protein QOK49_105, partial [Baekduia sp.]|nr:hypothetical protein [Baekduia sp.]